MTIDRRKRNTMKIMAASTGALFAPVVAGAATSSSLKDISQSAAETTIQLRGTGLQISLSHRYNVGSTNGSHTVVITNTSNEAVSLSHVYPGIVRTEDGSFDINSLLAKGPRVFEPRQPYLLQIERIPAGADAKERQLPTHIRSTAKLSVNTRSPAIHGGDEVTTTRTMFS